MKDIRQDLLSWLEGEGYPLEMQVAASFRKQGFDVLQSSSYEDPQDGTSREIDVVATDELNYPVNVSFVIECKSSVKKKPWILFTSPHTLEGLSIFFGYCVNSEQVRAAFATKNIDEVARLPWMCKTGRIAYGLVQAFRSQSDNADVTHRAVISVVKAAIARKRELTLSRPEAFVLAFPCVIVDCDMYECFLDDEGRMSIEKIENGFFYFPHSIEREEGTCIHVSTVNYLAQLAADARNVSDSAVMMLFADAKTNLRKLASG